MLRLSVTVSTISTGALPSLSVMVNCQSALGEMVTTASVSMSMIGVTVRSMSPDGSMVTVT